MRSEKDLLEGDRQNGRRQLSDPLDCLRLKLLDMLGSEGPRPSTLSVNASFSQLRWKPSCKSSR